MTIAFDRRGQLHTKSQMTDYKLRGDDLQDQNMILFFIDTFENQIDPKTHLNLEGRNENANTKCCGRPHNECVLYAEEHPQYSSKHQVYWRHNHNTLPNFVGPAFPHSDDKDSCDLYCACMLVLLKPWRNMETDLKQSNDTWEAVFEKFLNDAPTNVQDILSNIQYFHKCEAAACNSADVQMMPVNEEPMEVEEDVPYVPENIDQGNTDALPIKPMLTQEDIHAQLAVEKAKRAGVFTDEE